MKLLIDIPKEFEQHFKQDAFEDSLHRLSADAHLLAGNYEQETAAMLIEAFASAVTVPPHGRLIDEQWLNMQIHTAKEIHANEKQDFCNAFDSNGRVCTEWWCVEEMIDNAPTIIPASEEAEME
jgi:hypothetical protein